MPPKIMPIPTRPPRPKSTVPVLTPLLSSTVPKVPRQHNPCMHQLQLPALNNWNPNAVGVPRGVAEQGGGDAT